MTKEEQIEEEFKTCRGLLKSARHTIVLRNLKGEDGVHRLLIWEANGSGGNNFEIRRSGQLLLRTQDAVDASHFFSKEPLATTLISKPSLWSRIVGGFKLAFP